MKFVIFSPLAKTSAIGRVTALIVRAIFALGHTAYVIRTEQEDLLATPAHDSGATVVPWTDTTGVHAIAVDADALVYQIGNNYNYHCGGLHWLPKLPGIVCMHDFVVAHLFAEWAHGRRAEAERVLKQWYGEDAATAFFGAANPGAFIEMVSQHYPLTEWICSMALCVVSHSRWGMGRVAQSCPGPLRVLPLPYDAPSAAPASSCAQRSDGLVNMLTVGHANPNKRIDSVIRAIGASATLRELVCYRLCGLIQPPVALELTTLARKLGVNLVISGETGDLALQAAMKDADIVCCLRWPSVESASATTIEGLLYGKSVVVTNAAFYSELPDECVCKISPGNEVAELTAALEHLCTNANARLAMAKRGQTWATTTFSAANYAENLCDLARLASAAKPVIEMVKALSDALSNWRATPALLTSDDLAQPLMLFECALRQD